MILTKGRGSASVGLEPSTPAPHRGVWRKICPWLVSLAILAFLFTRVPLQTLVNAFKTGPWFYLAIYTFFQVVLVLAADGYATQVSLAITGFHRRFSRIFLVRGATYILGVLNYALGQGAFGLYLQRSGVATIQAAGAMLFVMIVNLGALLLVAAFGLLAGDYPGTAHFNFAPLGYGLLVVMVLYLAIIGLRPRRLQGYQLLAPLWKAGLAGHLKAVLGRLPHMLVLILTFWGALRLWGIPVPLVQGVGMVPLVLLIGALPCTPAGLGTTQAALVLLFSPYVPLPTPEVRVAALLAFSLIYFFLGILVQALLGIYCWRRLRQISDSDLSSS